MTKPRNATQKSRIAEFKSREEAAAFWDTHSLADYWDEFKPVEAQFAENLSEGLTIRLDPITLAEVRSVAKEQGIGPTTLMRMWVLERLRGIRKHDQK